VSNYTTYTTYTTYTFYFLSLRKLPLDSPSLLRHWSLISLFLNSDVSEAAASLGVSSQRSDWSYFYYLLLIAE
jgi:hypothetical protein